MDLLLLDYLLGVQTGISIVSEIRASGDQRPIMVLTGKGDENIVSELLKAGADDFLKKDNYSADLLGRSIINLIEKYRIKEQHALLEQELLESQKMDAIGTLASGIAHDFNNFLTSIMGFSELTILSRDFHDIEDKQRKIHELCETMSHMVKQLMDFTGKDQNPESEIDLQIVLEDTVNILSHTLSKGVEISLQMESVPPAVIGSSSMIQQLLFNLCINASEAMKQEGAIDITCTREVFREPQFFLFSSLDPREYVRISISDTGDGIEPEILNRIFEPFFTTKRASSKKGTGLGLAMVWKNMKMMNGIIDVKSEPSEGTTFHLYFPAVN